MRYKKLFFPVLAMVFVAGCYNDKADQLYPEPGTPAGPSCDTTNVSFATTIKPILKQYCTDPNCHIGNGTTGSYLLNTHAGVMTAVNNQRLLGAIMQQTGFVAMPQGMSKLTDCDINKISAWVSQGALDN